MAFLENIKLHYKHQFPVFAIVTYPFEEPPEEFDQWLSTNATENVVQELGILKNTLCAHVEELPNPQRDKIVASHRFTLVKFIDLKEQERIGRFYEIMVKLSGSDLPPAYANCHATFDENWTMNGILHPGQVVMPWI